MRDAKAGERDEGLDWVAKAQAKRFQWALNHGSLDFDDLFQAGRMGVMRARQTWREDGGANLATYATKWACHYIQREIERHGFVVRFGRKSARTWSNARWRVSIDDSNESTLGVAQPRDEVLPKKVIAALAALPERWRYVLVGRLERDQTLDEVGAELGICRERVRQLEAAALRRLRTRLGVAA